MFEIVRYTAERAGEWNRFVAGSKNATFLFDRRYMDYHRHRFDDYSLMAYLDGNLYALLPGHADHDVFYSHRGLTYGGLLMDHRAKAAAVRSLFVELNAYLRAAGIHKVVYKAIPWIYHRIPSEEDLYALFSVCEARLVDRSLSSVVCLDRRLSWRRDRRYGASRAERCGMEVGESDDFEGFWGVLCSNLERKYGARPVHTLEEIRLLRSRFPRHIRLFVARRNGAVLGGTVLYITREVVRAQYISASEEGKRLHAIDAVYDYILNACEWPCRYLDFGTSNGEDGRVLMDSLIYQKEGFGGRGVCYDIYEWAL